MPPLEAGRLGDNRTHTSFIHVRGYASLSQWTLCTSQCMCKCHYIRSFKTPSALHNIIGTLFAGYSGCPIQNSQRCTEASCISQFAFRSYVNYIFPSWFLSKTLTATIMCASAGEISVALSVRRIIPQGAELFRLTEMGDVESIKELFRSGLASPNDSTIGGVTALNVSQRTPLQLARCRTHALSSYKLPSNHICLLTYTPARSPETGFYNLRTAFESRCRPSPCGSVRREFVCTLMKPSLVSTNLSLLARRTI